MLGPCPLERRDVEVVFNFGGQFQQLETDTALFRPVASDLLSDALTSDTEMFGFISVSVVMSKGHLKFTVFYNRNMEHCDRMHRWADDLQTTLEALAVGLHKRQPRLTLTDLPLLDLTYDGIDDLHDRLREVGINVLDVESMCPCTPVQEGIIMAQQKEANNYWMQTYVRMASRDEHGFVSSEQVLDAWQVVCEHHPILRTVFGSDLCPGRTCHQLVIHTAAPTTYEHSLSGDNPVVELRRHPKPGFAAAQPCHQLVVCQVGDVVYVRLGMIHALVDATTVQLIWKELVHVYQSGMPTGHQAIYSQYVDWANSQRDFALRYWELSLAGCRPCAFPPLSENTSVTDTRGFGTTDVSYVDQQRILEFCKIKGVTVATLVRTTWALVLQAYTGRNDVFFGFLANGRDAPTDGVETMLGPTISMLPCSIDIISSETVLALMTRIQDTFLEGLPNQVFSIAELHHALGLDGHALFNTYIPPKGLGNDFMLHKEIMLNMLDSDDPSEIDISLAVSYTESELHTKLEYRRTHLSTSAAASVATMLAVAAEFIISNPDKTTAELIEVTAPRAATHVQASLQADLRLSSTRHDEVVPGEMPRTPNEHMLQGIWSDIMNAPASRLGVTDSYIKLGRDSIIAIKLAAACRSRSIPISVHSILTLKTIAALAASVGDVHSSNGVLNATGMPGQIFPLCPKQRMVVELQSQFQNHHAMGFQLSLRRTTDRDQLRSAIHALTEQHAILRARVLRRGHEWVQQISSDVHGSV